MIEHTSEPWHILPIPSAHGNILIGAASVALAETYQPVMATVTNEMIANSRRIVACVNACEGIDNDVLENIGRTKSPSPLAAMLTLAYDNLALLKATDQIRAQVAELTELKNKIYQRATQALANPPDVDTEVLFDICTDIEALAKTQEATDDKSRES